MIDLTPLDVRKKKTDFRKILRGYEPAEVEVFLEMVADRMEELVRENASLRDRSRELVEGLNAFRSREQAMNEALVSAQKLREDIRGQAEREAEIILREARSESERLVGDARREVERERESLQRAQSHRSRFLRAYRTFLEGQLEEIRVEEDRTSRARSGTDPAPLEGVPGDG